LPQHHERRVLPYSPDQMFAMVTDVARYPEFLPWVVAMRVRSDSEAETLADMIVGFKGLRERFTSRVIKDRPVRVTVDYVEGPLHHLHNEWQFTPEGNGHCRVDFMVEFAFRSRMFERLAGQMFDTALRKMIGAFEARAASLYGAGSTTTAASGSGAEGSSRPSA
jgi:coenzyme Q-binding protein COQ10